MTALSDDEVASLPDGAWKRIAETLPCGESTLVRMQTDDEELELPLRKYVELRLTALSRVVDLIRVSPGPSLLDDRKARKEIAAHADRFAVAVKGFYGVALDNGARDDLRELLAKVQEVADHEREVAAETKIKRGRKRDSAEQTVLLMLLSLYYELGGKLTTSHRDGIGAEGEAVEFLELTAEAVLGTKKLTREAAAKFIQRNRSCIGAYGQISTP